MRSRVALLASVAALLAGATASGALGAAGPSCGPTEVATLAASGVARVFSTGGVAYGCAAGSSRYARLGAVRGADFESGVGPIALAGRTVAYGVRAAHRHKAQVVVRRLGGGGLIGRYPSMHVPIRRGLTEEVDSLVVKRNGSVAWIASSGGPHFKESPVVVRLVSQGHQRLLDGGVGVFTNSLELHGSRLTWNNGGATQSATLR